MAILSIILSFGVISAPHSVFAQAFSAPFAESCFNTLTSKPYCVSRANATRVCSTYGTTEEDMARITKCLDDLSAQYKMGAVRGIQALCLYGFTQTGIAEQDSSNCQ